MADMKQKAWWESRTDDPKYKDDWIVVMALHGLEWSVFVSLPCMFALGEVPIAFVAMVLLQAFVHSAVDHLKANELAINLVQDQAIHMVQIAVILITYMVVA